MSALPCHHTNQTSPRCMPCLATHLRCCASWSPFSSLSFHSTLARARRRTGTCVYARVIVRVCEAEENADFSADARDAPSAWYACKGRHAAALSICVSCTGNASLEVMLCKVA